MAQQHKHYQKIAQAIQYLNDNFKQQPELHEVADVLGISPSHLQRLFTQWAGVSPKKFLQYLSIEHAKKLLATGNTSMLNVSLQTGLSGSGRLHDLFVTIEGMTPGEYANGGERLVISYCFAESLFGTVLVATTHKGVCHLAFADDGAQALAALRMRFPKATYIQKKTILARAALSFLAGEKVQRDEVALHLKGTPFQLKVWEALLRIPEGSLTTYTHIAQAVERPSAVRAVGTAVGANPVAVLIPCHRVIRASGALGDYHWGSSRKQALVGFEAASTDPDV